jgi:hypothetical protein
MHQKSHLEQKISQIKKLKLISFYDTTMINLGMMVLKVKIVQEYK